MHVRYKKAFTLVEVFVVMSIITFLFSIIIVSLKSARTAAVLASAKIFEATNNRAFGGTAIVNWDFNNPVNGSGNTATIADMSASGNDLIVTDKSQLDSSNTFNGSGYSLKCAGTCPVTNPIVLKLPTGFRMGNTVNAMTISAWCNMSSTVNQDIFYINSNSNFRFLAYSGQLYLNFFDALSTLQSKVILPNFTTATWHHFAFSYKTGVVNVYIDGKLSATYSAGLSNFNDSNFYLANGLSTGSFNIDDITIFSESLTAENVQKMYAEGLPKHTFAKND
ncbi:MAG: LamG-like jellyroll fold domain-containing protein [bacterium]